MYKYKGQIWCQLGNVPKEVEGRMCLGELGRGEMTGRWDWSKKEGSGWAKS